MPLSQPTAGRYPCVTRDPTAWNSRRSGLSAIAAKPSTRSTSNCSPASDARGERGRIGDFRSGHDKAVEIVVVVLALQFVDRGSRGEVVLGRGIEPKRHAGRHLAVARLDQPHPRP